ncbi:MAG TPA: BatD family protein, partial [Flavitalea sp.]|nr:BatD family protein [Flavitalea sp.]
MKFFTKTWLAFLMFLLTTFHLSAQVTFITRADHDIIEGEPFEVQYILQGATQFTQFNIPPMSDFQLVEVYDLPAGQKYNDVLQRIEDVLTRVAVLKPNRKGAAWIPGATVEVNGKAISSNRVRVNIASAPSKELAENEVEDASYLLPGEDIEKKIQKNFFLTASVTKSSCYVGEPLMAVYKACSRLNARSQVSKRPSFTGFSVVEMVDGYDSEPSVEKVNGENFFVHLVRKVQLFPLQAGKYEIDNAQVESVIQFAREGGDVSSSLNRSGDVLRHAVTVSSKTLPVEVNPLPEAGQPANFSGAVGSYTIEAAADKHKIESGDAIHYKLTIRGKGNFPLITAPDLSFPAGISKGEVKVTDELNPYNFPLSGTKTFEYELNIKRGGLVTIPSVNFSYFDPADKSYHMVESNPVDVIVEQASKPVALQVIGKTEPTIPRHYYFLTFIAVAILAVVTIQLIRSNSNKSRPVVEEVIAEPVVVDPMETAETAFRSGDYRGFILEIQKLIYHTCIHRYDIPNSTQNREQLKNCLLGAGASHDLTDRVYNLLSACEWQLYTPSMDSEEVAKIRTEAISILDTLKASA